MLPKRELLTAAVFLSAMIAVTMTATLYAADRDSDGFVELFNGRDLSDWKTAGDWDVQEGGILALRPKPGRRGFSSYRLNLWTKKKYGDFILAFEFKITEGGDSSVFVRAASVFSFTEVEIDDAYGKTGPLTNKDCGGVVKVVAPSKNMAKPAGQWNRMVIICQGSQLEVELNGEQVVDLDFRTSSKSMASMGNIGLQDWGHPVWFRNVRIKELKP